MSLNTTPTETVIFHNPETGRFGYKVRFVNTDDFHKVWDTCETPQDALSACDPHQEYIWDEPEGADASVLMISRGYREDSVAWRMERWSGLQRTLRSIKR